MVQVRRYKSQEFFRDFFENVIIYDFRNFSAFFRKYFIILRVHLEDPEVETVGCVFGDEGHHVLFLVGGSVGRQVV